MYINNSTVWQGMEDQFEGNTPVSSCSRHGGLWALCWYLHMEKIQPEKYTCAFEAQVAAFAAALVFVLSSNSASSLASPYVSLIN